MPMSLNSLNITNSRVPSADGIQDVHQQTVTSLSNQVKAASSCGMGYAIKWQSGTITQNGRNGAFLEDIIKSCIYRLMDYQNCHMSNDSYNDRAIAHLQDTIKVLSQRAADRKARGVLDTHKK